MRMGFTPSSAIKSQASPGVAACKEHRIAVWPCFCKLGQRYALARRHRAKGRAGHFTGDILVGERSAGVGGDNEDASHERSFVPFIRNNDPYKHICEINELANLLTNKVINSADCSKVVGNRRLMTTHSLLCKEEATRLMGYNCSLA